MKMSTQRAVPLIVVSAFIFFLSHSAVSRAEEAMSPEKESAGAKPREVAVDTDKDGKPDRWEYYKEDGKLDRIEVDNNHDGKIDETVFAENGKIVRVEKDSDFDGKIDQWVKY